MRKSIMFFVALSIVSCTSRHLSVSEIKQGRELQYAVKSHTGQYFAIFSIKSEKVNKAWEVLYQDTVNIYFGNVQNKSLFSKEKALSFLYKIPIAEMKQDIPFFSNENWQAVMLDSINTRINGSGRHTFFDITSAHTILRGDSINYQVEGITTWFHFEAGKQTGKTLVILGKKFNILDIYSITN